MAKSRRQLDDHPSLFAIDGGQNAEPSHLVDAQSPEALDARTPKVVSLNHRREKVGRLGAQTGRPTKKYSEALMPSRQMRRLSLRVDPNLANLVIKECRTEEPALDIGRVVEDGWRLWLEARRQMKAERLDAQTPTVVSSGSSGSDPHSSERKEERTTTTTTLQTLGAQTPKSPPLPGFAAKVLETVPQGSRHSFEINRAYAWDQHTRSRGITNPDVWALENFRTGKASKGKGDLLVDLWLSQKEAEEEEAAAAVAERERRRAEDIERLAQIERERAGRDKTKGKWRQ